jgi:hypothetical protein
MNFLPLKRLLTHPRARSMHHKILCKSAARYDIIDVSAALGHFYTLLLLNSFEHFPNVG